MFLWEVIKEINVAVHNLNYKSANQSTETFK